MIGAELVYGEWELEPDGILISEPLAIQIFKKSDCLGSLVTVRGETYSVSGVYRLQGGFMRELSEDGNEMVLLDLNEAQETWPIETILFCRATIQIGQRGKRREKKVEGQSLHILHFCIQTNIHLFLLPYLC